VKTLALALLVATTVEAQISLKPPDAIVPVVGSTRGQSNAHFKTELQLANGSDVPMAGWLVLRPQSVFRRYDLPAHTTLSFSDIVADLGASGLGSIDILADVGPVPTVVTRAYDDQPGGTTGVTVPLVPFVSVLGGVNRATLIVPRDLVRYRFNIGVRTLDDGVTLALTLRSANGTERHRRTVEYGGNHFGQQPGDIFIGAALQADDSIEVRIVAGSAIVYATTVDNRTNDSSIQIALR
jgi:hypothetical protein